MTRTPNRRQQQSRTSQPLTARNLPAGASAPTPAPRLSLPLRLPYRSGIESDHVTHCDVCRNHVKLGTMWHCPIEGKTSVRLLCHTCKEREYDMPRAIVEPAPPDSLDRFNARFGMTICTVAACAIAYRAAGRHDAGDLVAILLLLGMQMLVGRCL